MFVPTQRQRAWLFGLIALAVLWTAATATPPAPVWAQAAPEDVAGPSGESVPAEPAAAPEAAEAEPGQAEPPAPAAARRRTEGIKFFSLILSGGWLMLPILLMSLLVVTFAIERSLALRRARVLPDELVTRLGQLGGSQGGFDPRQAYRLCQQFPSSASHVIRAMLLKIGRPHSEVEHAVAEASEREAERIYGNVRWLNLAAAVTPLMGLLGTVWGMIRAFHDTTHLAPGQNKADYLAQGIYVALVTTLAGLSVAIPAAILSHYFEGRITRLFHQIDELLFNLLPQIERYEGRVRFGHGGEQRPAPPPIGEVPPPPAQQTASVN